MNKSEEQLLALLRREKELVDEIKSILKQIEENNYGLTTLVIKTAETHDA